MVYRLTDAHRAEWTALPDDHFPKLGGLKPEGALGDIPLAGQGLWVMCVGCWKARWMCGEAICRTWPALLDHTLMSWGRSLRCQECGAKRFAAHPEADPAADAFMGEDRETAPQRARRRMSAWLAGTGVDLEALPLAGLRHGT